MPSGPDRAQESAGALPDARAQGQARRGIADLLDREIPQGYREEWTQLVAETDEDGRSDTASLFVFRLGLEWMALPAGRIQRVTGGSAPHSIPRRHGILLGLISVQGELVLCVSLSHLLALENGPQRQRATETGRRRYVVAAGDGGPVAFAVDEVHGILSYRESELREVPSTVAEGTAMYTTAVLPWKEQVIGCLDDQVLFYAIDRNLS